MIARTIARVPRLLRQAVASGTATALDTALLLVLAHGLGVAVHVAAALGCVLGGAVNFALGRAWVYRAGQRTLARQLVRYAVVVVGGGAVVSAAAVAGLCRAGLPLVVAKGIAVVVTMVGWTYPMAARAVFGGDRTAPARSGTMPESWLPCPGPLTPRGVDPIRSR